MAKQPKTDTATGAAAAAPANTTATAAAPTPQEKAERNKTDRFKRVLDKATGKGVVPAKKLAPQAQLIIDTIEAAGPDGISREDLNAKLVPAGLKTRQPVGRIVTYYQKALVEAGTITIGKTDVAPAAQATQ